MAKDKRGGKRAKGSAVTAPVPAVKASADGVITAGDTIALVNDKSVTGHSMWKYTVMEVDTDGQGNVTLSYASPTSYEKLNSNTTRAHYDLTSGIYTQPGDRTLRTHNLDLNKAKSVSGNTFDIKDWLKKQGFTKWDSKTKSWVRP